MADIVISEPTPSQFVKYSKSMKRVSYKTTQDTSVASAFIVNVDPEGKFMKIRAGRKYYCIHPQYLKEISFYEN